MIHFGVCCQKTAMETAAVDVLNRSQAGAYWKKNVMDGNKHQEEWEESAEPASGF